MKHFFFSSIFIGVYFFAQVSIAQEDNWQLKKDEEGIAIYTREVTGSNIKEFKAATTINASREALVEVIIDVENYPKWITDVSSAKRLFYQSDSIGMYYTMDLPWPIKDRDMVMISHLKNNPDSSALFVINSADGLVDEDNDFIRIKEARGQWYIKPIGKNKCEVTYRFLADPEGALPAWVINIFIVDGPFETLQNLKEYTLK